MSSFEFFPDMFKEVVDNVRLEYDVNNLSPYLGYGTAKELQEMLVIKDNNQIDKYPLIWLVWDSDNANQQWKEPYIYSISPKMFIVTLTNQDYTLDERQTNVFLPVLYPLFQMFIDNLEYHQNIELNDDFSYKTTDHPYLLTNTGQMDHVSAIEIELKNLLLLKS